MKNTWTLLCQKAIVDDNTRLLSAINIIDTINIGIKGERQEIDLENPKDIGPIDIYIVSNWKRSSTENPESGKCRYIVVGPNGKKLKSTPELDINLDSNKGHNTIISMDRITYIGLGEYQIVVEKKDGENWVQETTLPLLVQEAVK